MVNLSSRMRGGSVLCPMQAGSIQPAPGLPSSATSLTQGGDLNGESQQQPTAWAVTPLSARSCCVTSDELPTLSVPLGCLSVKWGDNPHVIQCAGEMHSLLAAPTLCEQCGVGQAGVAGPILVLRPHSPGLDARPIPCTWFQLRLPQVSPSRTFLLF